MNKLKLIYLSIYLLFLYNEFILKKFKISYASLKQLSLYIFAYGKFLFSSKFFSIQAVMLQQNRRVTIKIIQKLPTLMESKHAVTRPFWTSTWGGGCANLHSVSVRVHLLRWYSRQTSRVSHRESFTLLPIANRLFTMAITRCHTKMKDCWVSYDQTQKFQSREPIKGAQFFGRQWEKTVCVACENSQISFRIQQR